MVAMPPQARPASSGLAQDGEGAAGDSQAYSRAYSQAYSQAESQADVTGDAQGNAQGNIQTGAQGSPTDTSAEGGLPPSLTSEQNRQAPAARERDLASLLSPPLPMAAGEGQTLADEQTPPTTDLPTSASAVPIESPGHAPSKPQTPDLAPGLAPDLKPALPQAPAELMDVLAQNQPLPVNTGLEPSHAHSLDPSVLPPGSWFSCVLLNAASTRVGSPMRCMLTQSVYSMDGRQVLLRRGCLLEGVVQHDLAGQASNRVLVQWRLLRSPEGQQWPLDAPATDALGQLGLPARVDDHWAQGLGSAAVLSVLDDSSLWLQALQAQHATTVVNGNTVVLPNASASAQGLASKALNHDWDAPASASPSVEQGTRLGVVVMHELDLSGLADQAAANSGEAAP